MVTRIKTDIKISNNGPDIFIVENEKLKIILFKVEIASQDNLQVELEKGRYLSKRDWMLNKCIKTTIIP